MRHVTIRQLQVFVEAAQALSFARVADRLHLTPAGVSFQIKQIESQTGFALFERVGKKVALTDAGRILLGYAKQMLQSLNDADQAMTALKGLSGGQATIGLVSTAKYIVPHMLTRFQAEYPAVALTLMDGNRRWIIDALVKGDIDLAIMGQPPANADVSAEPFAPHPSVIAAAPTHPLVGHGDLPASVLAGEPFVVREEGSGTRSLMDRFFQGAGLAPRIAMTTSSNETIKQAVMAGMGVAFISEHTIGLELAAAQLCVLKVEGLPVLRRWYVVHLEAKRLSPAAVAFKKFMLDEGSALLRKWPQG